MPIKSIVPHKETGAGKVRWRVNIPCDISEKRQRKFFKTKGDALQFCADLERSRRGNVLEFHALDESERAIVLDSLRRVGGAHALASAVSHYLATKPGKEIHVAELVDLCLNSKESSGLTAKHIANMRSVLERFAAGMPARYVHSIEPREIEAWLNRADWSQSTKRDYLKEIRTLFSYAVKHRYRVDNPADAVEPPVQADKKIGILSPENAEKLMRSVESNDPGLQQYVALCLFGGLRPSEAFRVAPGDIKAESIAVLGKRNRARARRLVTINETLRAWLPKDGEYSPANLRKRMDAVRAGIPWPQDCMRHSFVSYHFALHGAALTAKEAGHSEAVLFAHYREIVTKAEAERFWGIRPR